MLMITIYQKETITLPGFFIWYLVLKFHESETYIYWDNQCKKDGADEITVISWDHCHLGYLLVSIQNL